MERVVKLASVRRNKGKAVQPRTANPYTVKTVDEAITHLERALSFPGATRVFGRDYWHIRITELLAYPALTPTQITRVSRLAQLLATQGESGPCGTAAARVLCGRNVKELSR